MFRYIIKSDVTDEFEHWMCRIFVCTNSFKSKGKTWWCWRCVTACIRWTVVWQQHCHWNTLLFENYGCFKSGLRNSFYKDKSVVNSIATKMMHCEDVASALRESQGSATYYAVKQLTGHTELGLKNEDAGALTNILDYKSNETEKWPYYGRE